MSSEANLRKKTGKLPVQLYRTFFKLSIAAAVYAVFCILMGGGEVRSEERRGGGRRGQRRRG